MIPGKLTLTALIALSIGCVEKREDLFNTDCECTRIPGIEKLQLVDKESMSVQDFNYLVFINSEDSIKYAFKDDMSNGQVSFDNKSLIDRFYLLKKDGKSELLENVCLLDKQAATKRYLQAIATHENALYIGDLK